MKLEIPSAGGLINHPNECAPAKPLWDSWQKIESVWILKGQVVRTVSWNNHNPGDTLSDMFA